MDPRGLSLTVETDHIGRVALGKRAVFYDELAQYGPRYIRGRATQLLSVEAEARYHLNNLILLSMYFDVVFIQTAAIFNVNDLFLRAVIQRTISNSQFRSLMKTGCVRICGWGGSSPREMFSNALDYASAGVTSTFSPDYVANLRHIFLPEHLTYRVQDHPEDEAAQFRRVLRETEIISAVDDLDRVERAIDHSERRLGALTAMSFFPALNMGSLQANSSRIVYSSFMNSWGELLNQQVPDVHAYVEGTDASAIQQAILIDGKRLRAFLFSPRIFAAFLGKYFSATELNRILGRPYEDIHKLRNGDWKRFCDAYHSSVELVSDSMSEMDFSMLQIFGLQDQQTWGTRIWSSAGRKGSNFDVDAFLQSLASISGAIFGIPLLGPAMHVAGVAVGRRINSFYSRLARDYGNRTSPYIRKVRMNLTTQVRTA